MTKPDMETTLIALFESVLQADYDLCGQQRRWHLPRLQRVMRDFMILFPAEAAGALSRAVDADGLHYKVTEAEIGLNITKKGI